MESRSEMVMVVTFGGTAGLITFTDLISEIIGDDDADSCQL